MSSRMIRSIIAIVILGVFCCYLFYLNPGSVTVNLSPNHPLTAPIAIVLLVVFFLGALVVGFFASLFSAVHSFTDWKRERKYRREIQHREQLGKARDALLTDNFQEAQSMLERIVAREPENTLAWLSLADVAERISGLQSSISVLDRARLQLPKSAEILLRSAATSERLGNLTGAFDNLQLLLRQHPGNARILRMLFDCSRKLGRFESAIGLARELLKKVSGSAQDRLYDEIADCELAQALQTYKKSPNGIESTQLRNAIEDVIRRHRNHLPSLDRLAQFELAAGDFNEATRLLSRCFALSGLADFLNRIADLWLAQKNPTKAVQSVTAAVNGQKDNANHYHAGLLNLSELGIKLGTLEEALTNLNRIPKESAFYQRASILRGFIAARKGELTTAVDLYSDALHEALQPVRSSFPGNSSPTVISGATDAPSPTLSTP